MSTSATILVILVTGPRAVLGTVLLFWVVLAALGLFLWLRKYRPGHGGGRDRQVAFPRLSPDLGPGPGHGRTTGGL